jgi:hypothetical protein
MDISKIKEWPKPRAVHEDLPSSAAVEKLAAITRTSLGSLFGRAQPLKAVWTDNDICV